MRPDKSDGLERLGAALELYLAWREAGEETWDEFSARHADYRELLEHVADGYRESTDTGPGTIDTGGTGTGTGTGDDTGDDTSSAMVGRRLGDFRIVRELGRGGMGVVYEAEQISLDRRVALKVLPGRGANPVWVARFKREAATVAKLKHDGIVEVIAVGTEGDLHYYAMELVEGVALNTVFESVRSVGLEALSGSSVATAVREALPGVSDPKSKTEHGAPAAQASGANSRIWQRGYVEAVVELIAQVAEALQHTHDSGVIHRDVKPGNILVRLDGRAVLTDFGLAREEGLPSMTQTGQFVGTPYYVSPEQALARLKQLDHRTDVFSLGATLYELVTLKRPFDGESTHEILQRIVSSEPTDPQRINRHLPADLAAVILKAMEKTPARRYQSAAEMAGDLRAFLEYRPVRARRATTLQRIGRWARREPMRAALVAVIGLAVPVVTGLSGYMLAKRSAIDAGEDALLREELDRFFERAYLAMDFGRLGIARGHFDDVLRLSPNNPEAIAGIALLLNSRANRTGADRAALLEQAIELLDAHPELLARYVCLGQLKARALRGLGNSDDARKLEAGLGELREPLDFYNASLQTILFGVRTARQKVKNEARNLALAAVMTAEQSRPLFHFRLAQTAYRAGDTETLNWVVRSIRQLWPDSLAARYWIGASLSLHDPSESARIFEELLSETGAGRDAWIRHYLVYYLAFAKEQSGDHATAVTLYREALAHMPDDQDCRFFLCRALFANGETAESEKELRAAIARHPKERRSYVLLSEILARRAEVQEALNLCERALSEIPGDVQLLVLKGMTLGRLSRFEESGKVLREVLRIAPDNIFALSNLATLLARQGGFEEAREYFVQAADLMPGKAHGWYSAGLCDLRLKETERAVRCFRRALEQEPDHGLCHGRLVQILRQQSRDEEVEAELARFAKARAKQKGR